MSRYQTGSAARVRELVRKGVAEPAIVAERVGINVQYARTLIARARRAAEDVEGLTHDSRTRR